MSDLRQIMLRRCIGWIASVFATLFIFAAHAAEPAGSAANGLPFKVDALADRFNTIAATVDLPVRMTLRTCERGTVWICQYRIGDFITAYGRSTDQPPAMNEFLMQFAVDRTKAVEGAMDMLFAIAVVLKQYSPHSTKDDNNRVLEAITAARDNPGFIRTATIGRLRYTSKLEVGNGLWVVVSEGK